MEPIWWALTKMGRRSYDPRSGIFLSRDSVIGNPMIPQGLNGYSYAFINPFTFNDATGNWAHFRSIQGLGRPKGRKSLLRFALQMTIH